MPVVWGVSEPRPLCPFCASSAPSVPPLGGWSVLPWPGRSTSPLTHFPLYLWFLFLIQGLPGGLPWEANGFCWRDGERVSVLSEGRSGSGAVAFRGDSARRRRGGLWLSGQVEACPLPARPPFSSLCSSLRRAGQPPRGRSLPRAPLGLCGLS